MRLILSILMGAALTGCASMHAQQADSTCQSYGARPGTDLYVQCRMSAESIRMQKLTAYAIMIR